MTTAGSAGQHEPAFAAPLAPSPAPTANNRTYRTSHERSQGCSFAVDVAGQAREPGLRQHGEGERALMRAVLSDAIRCLAGRGREGQLRKLEARRWVASRNTRWPFSFENICCVLDIDPQTLRRRLAVPARDTIETRPSLAPPRPSDDRPDPGLDAVTPREREIIRQVAFGRRNAEVAAKLHITRRTVTTHLANIFRKLGIHERRELFGFALRTAII